MAKIKIDKEMAKIVRMGREAFEKGLPRSAGMEQLNDAHEIRLWNYAWDLAKLTANLD